MALAIWLRYNFLLKFNGVIFIIIPTGEQK